MPQPPTEPTPQDENLRSVLMAIDTEVDRQLAEQTRSEAALTNRAVLLVSSTLIFVSIPKDGDGSGWSYTLALAAALAGAVLGGIALFSKSKSTTAKVDSLEKQLLGATEIEAIRALTASKRADLQKNRQRANTIARLTSSGFVLLIVSLFFITIYLLTEGLST